MATAKLSLIVNEKEIYNMELSGKRSIDNIHKLCKIEYNRLLERAKISGHSTYKIITEVTKEA